MFNESVEVGDADAHHSVYLEGFRPPVRLPTTSQCLSTLRGLRNQVPFPPWDPDS